MPTASSWPELRAAPSWRERSIRERAEALESACRTAMQIVADDPNGTERLLKADPLPASTIEHLRRLARRYAGG